MVKRLNKNDMKSLEQQAKEDKQKVNRTNQANDLNDPRIGTIDFSDGSGCGLKNPCVFSPKF